MNVIEGNGDNNLVVTLEDGNRKRESQSKDFCRCL